MNKLSGAVSNNFCPQTLFIYGTYREDNSPNFGLFCWFSYIWDNGLGVMACIGGDKLTKDLIRKNGIFSANLVTEELLPVADYFGNKNGYDPDKMNNLTEVIPGEVLHVPILKKSPRNFELEVFKTVVLSESDIFFCKIRNNLADEILINDNMSVEERMKYVSPVITTQMTYFSLDGKSLGKWGEPQKSIVK